MTENTHAGRLIVLTGPTAVGKGTVEAKLRADHPEVWVSVSATTRAPRPGEVDGVNYWFLTEDEFLAREAAGEFLETAVVHGMAHYGTLLKPVEEHLAAGVPTILEIDLQGARRVKQRAAELDLEVVYVFIAPPSFEELERRLIGRGTETAEQQARRLETAKVELAAESEFDVTISETANPAPIFLQSWRKGRSVTPAIGATNRLLRSVKLTNSIGEGSRAGVRGRGGFYPEICLKNSQFMRGVIVAR